MGTALRNLAALRYSATALLLAGSAGASELLWPLQLQPALSSTFGESRSTAFHMGIDLKTWGKTGFDVRAPADGYVMRLRTSPWGYGRALYLKLADGRILVFGHLSGFDRRSAQRVEQAQREHGRYSVDIWLKPEELPVRRGDLIARTGDSGAGPPHLHLEVRDADNVAINPLDNGFRIPDAVAPTISHIALIPVGSGSAADGRHEPLVLALRWNETTKRFENRHVPSVYGRIGVSVLEYDRMDGTSNKVASHQLRLIVDRRNHFRATYNRVSYADRHQIFLDRTGMSLNNRRRNFSNLFLRPGNRLGFYDKTGRHRGLLFCGTGPRGLAKGDHSLVAIVADKAGNASTASLRFQVNASPEILTADLIDGDDADRLEVELGDEDDNRLELTLTHSVDGQTWSTVARERVPLGVSSLPLGGQRGVFRLIATDGSGAEAMVTVANRAFADRRAPELSLRSTGYADGVDLTIQTSEILAAVPRVAVAARQRVFEVVARQEELLTYRAHLPLDAESVPATATVRVTAVGPGGSPAEVTTEFNLEALEPSRAQQLLYGGALLTVPAGAAYQRLIPQVGSFHPESPGELQGTGVGLQFEPAGTSFDHPVNLQISYPDTGVDPDKLGIYRKTANGAWALLGNQLDRAAGTIACEIRRFSRFALLADLTPPTIVEVRPADGELVRVRRPHLWVRFEEEGSGISAEEDVVLELDGRILISEYDPDAGSVSYLMRENLTSGRHRLRIRLTDASGNETAAETAFVVE